MCTSLLNFIHFLIDALAKTHSADPDVGDFFSIDFLVDFVGFSLLCGCGCGVGEGDGFTISAGTLNGKDEVDDEEEDIAEYDSPFICPALRSNDGETT